MKIFIKSKLSQIKQEFLGWPLIFCSIIIIADQITKLWAIRQTADNRGVIEVVIPGYLNWAHHRNPGAAWGMFGEHTNILAWVSLTAFLYLIYEFKALTQGKKSYRFFLSILMGGILGNWYDRQFRPAGVVDMIQTFIPMPNFVVEKWPQYMTEQGSYVFPTFNIADSAICVAAIFFLIASIFEKDTNDKKSEKKAQ